MFSGKPCCTGQKGPLCWLHEMWLPCTYFKIRRFSPPLRCFSLLFATSPWVLVLVWKVSETRGALAILHFTILSFGMKSPIHSIQTTEELFLCLTGNWSNIFPFSDFSDQQLSCEVLLEIRLDHFKSKWKKVPDGPSTAFLQKHAS